MGLETGVTSPMVRLRLVAQGQGRVWVLTWSLGVAGYRPIDQACIQALWGAGQAHDCGLVRCVEVLKPHLLAALTAFVNGNAANKRAHINRPARA